MKQTVAAALVASFCLASTAGASDSVAYRFEWQGGDGYLMRGAMSFPAEFTKLTADL